MRKNKILLIFTLFLALILTLVYGCEKPEISFDFEVGPIELNYGETHQIDYSVYNAENFEASFEITGDAITCDANGIVTAVKEGSSTVKVTVVAGDVQGEGTITINVVDNRKVIVTLNAKGGTCDQSSLTVKYGKGVTLPQATKEGYTFLGWSKVDGETVYVNELSNLTADITVYANYAQISYDIVYNLDGGALEEAQNKIGWGDDLILKAPTKAGYRFLGWALSADASEYVETIQTVKANVEVFAKWEAIKHSISYVLNDGIQAEGNPVEFAEAEEVSLKPATKDHYVFDGWYIGETKVDKIAKGTTADVTLEARFSPAKYKITYVLDGGTNAQANKAEVAYGEELTLAEPTKAGYSFLGWYEGETLVTKVSPQADITLTAKWKATSKKITYNYNGAEPKDYLSAITDEWLTDFRSTGAYSASNATTIDAINSDIIDSSAVIAMIKDATLTAKWSWLYDAIYKIAGSPDGKDYKTINWDSPTFGEKGFWLVNIHAALAGKSYKDGAFGESYAFGPNDLLPYLPTPVSGPTEFVYGEDKAITIEPKTSEGQEFAGWYYKGSKIENTKQLPNEDVVLEAKFKSPITWDAGEGTLDPNSITIKSYVAGEERGIDVVPTAPQGYQFVGWKYGSKLVTNISQLPGSAVTLVASYREIPTGLTVGAGETYETLAAAYDAAKAGDTLVVKSGEFTLNFVIAKDINIIGEGKNKTTIYVPKDQAGNIAASAYFEGVTIKGDGGGAGVPGVTFQSVATTGLLSLVNCHLCKTNTLVRFEKGDNAKVVIDGCTIEEVGQFVVWMAKGVGVEVLNSSFDVASCGAIVNSAAALLRVRAGSLKVTHCEFKGDTPSIDGLFEVGTTNATVGTITYCTFEDVSMYVHKNTGNQITFNHNLYIKSGVIQSESKVKGDGVVADQKIYTTKEELETAYAKTLGGPQYSYIRYELNGGENPANAISEYEEGKVTTLPTPTRENYEFLGWCIGKLSEEYITEISATQKSDIVLHAAWKRSALEVGEGKKYATIADALAKAIAGDTIILQAGTYSEVVTIEIDDLTIAGPNKEVAYSGTRSDEAILNSKIIVKAKNFSLVGIKGTEKFVVDINGVVGVKVLNCIFAGSTLTNSDCADFAVNSRQGIIGATANSENILVDGCLFDLGSAVYRGVAISNYVITNFTFTNNKVVNAIDGSKTYEDSIRFNSIAGKMLIDNNIFNYSTDNYTIFLGNDTNTCYLIQVTNNVFDKGGQAVSSGIALRRSPAGSKVVISGNSLSNIGGNIFDFTNSTAAVTIEVNVFNCAYKCSKVSSGSMSYVNNYYTVAQTTTTSDAKAIADQAAYDNALAAWKLAEASKVNNNIVYILNGGSFATSQDPTYEQGKVTKLPTPTKAGYEFLGWSLTSTFEALISEISAETTGDITLYAKFAMYRNVSYVLDGGEGVADGKREVGYEFTLPTPTKAGFKFAGWYDNADFAGYPIAKISAEDQENHTYYALWQVEGSFTVTYKLNGGNTLYNDRAQLAKDLLADYNKFMSKNIAMDNFFNASYGPTYAQVEPFFTTSYKDKWGWVLEYFQKLDAAGNKPKTTTEDNYTKSVAWIRGCMHNFLLGSDSCEYGIKFDSYANGNGFWGSMQTEITKESSNDILQVYYPYYTFLGWYENADFSGSPVRTLTKNTTLYAKFEITSHKIIYHLNNNAEGIALASGAKTEFTAADSFKFDDPEYSVKKWIFNGWFYDAKLTMPANGIEECTTSDIELYASWTEVAGYTINYVLNGGSIKYSCVEDIIDDFLKDYNVYNGSNYDRTTNKIESGSFTLINFHTFFNQVLADGTNIRAKWLWLAQALYDISVELGAGSCNKTGLKALINNTAYAGDDIYGISYAFRAFLLQTTLRPGSSYSSVDFSVIANQQKVWPYASKVEDAKSINNQGDVTPKTPTLLNYAFIGWYDNKELNGSPVTLVTESMVDANNTVTLYAKYGEAVTVSEIKVNNQVSELVKFTGYQLSWDVLPANANVKGVVFSSSDSKVATIDDKGYIYPIKEGKTTITIKSNSISGTTTSFEITVYSPDHFEISYDGESYVNIGETTKFIATLIKKDNSKVNATFEAVNPDIATIDAAGVITGVKAGLAKFVAKAQGTEGEKKIEFYVTVLESNLSDEIKFVVDSHNSNALTVYNLGIGSGTPEYYVDIIGSVSRILFNENLTVNTMYKATQDANSANHYADEGRKIEFVTVHYTGNMAATSDGDNNAQYFASSSSVSIHYTTGTYNNTAYQAFYVLDEKYGGYHASDSAQGKTEWYATGVKVAAGDPKTPEFSVEDGYFTINGKKTSIKIPTRSDGIVVTGPTFVKDGVTHNTINKMGLAYKIVGDEYYMDKTWWGTQENGWVISSVGGNRNSVGIESCVDKKSDLMHTWQTTAQLVASILIRNDLGLDRVVGHHFFSGKDCPQPLLANDMQLWEEFMECVKAEYTRQKQFASYNFEMEVVAGSEVVKGTKGTEVAPGITGRLIQDGEAHVVLYKAKVNGKEITLATAVNSVYSDCGCTGKVSIQKTGTELY